MGKFIVALRRIDAELGGVPLVFEPGDPPALRRETWAKWPVTTAG